MEPETEATLQAAEVVVQVLAEQGLDVLLIGALALAVHGYERGTGDLDLALATQPAKLQALEPLFAARGWESQFRPPDGNDPLGGVLVLMAPGALPIEVVNFSNPPASGFPRLVHDALATAQPLHAGSRLRVMGVLPLIASKLYAGGRKSRLDIIELLERHPAVTEEELREMAERYGLTGELEAVLRLRTQGA